MRILAICGSLRARSSNAALLDAAVLVAPNGVSIERSESIASLPHFNPDTEMTALPETVAAFRRAVGDADALLLSSPEYAHGIAGSFKNALDWLVGSTEFPGKPVGILNAAPRATHAEAQLREILRTMSATLVEPAMLSLPIQSSGLDAAGIAADPALTGPLRKAIEALAAAV
jgi:chromate reductase, NAD(P)H dehydrogenase (quinone)